MNKKHPVSSSCVGEKHLLDESQKRMVRLLKANRKDTSEKLTSCYNSDVKKGLTEYTI